MRAFLERLDRWRTAARRGPLSTLIWGIYTETGYLSFAAAMPGGEQRRANLLALYERARQFDRFARQGLFRFLRFVEDLEKREVDLGTAPVLGGDEDAVRISTIHKSKGLEFPVVIVADLGREIRSRRGGPDLLTQRTLGLGARIIDPELGVKYPSIAHHAVREALDLEERAEEMRILYVALTRARERLVLVGSARGLARACSRWSGAAARASGPLPDEVLASAKTYLDWIGPAIALHPDGEPIRRAAGDGAEASGPRPASDPSRWRVVVWGPEDQARLSPAVGARRSPRGEPDWGAIARGEPLPIPGSSEPSPARIEMARRLAWRYPFEAACGLLAKRAATDLEPLFSLDFAGDSEAGPLAGIEDRGGPKGARSAPFDVRPRFLEERRPRPTAAERGSAYHLVLEKLDLSGALDAAGAERQIEGLVERALLTREQAATVRAESIAAFFASPLGRRLVAGRGRIRREVPFTWALPAREIHRGIEGPAGDDRVIVQGVIDVLMETEDGRGYVIVDWKTGRGAGPDEDHRGQIRLYARAASEILGRPVIEAYLGYLDAGEVVSVALAP